MTLDELIQACRANGPWCLDEAGRIRDALGRCPLDALGYVGAVEAATVDTGLDCDDIVGAADDCTACGQNHAATRAALLTLVEP